METLTFKIEKEFEVDVEYFAGGLQDYFNDVLTQYIGLDYDEIEVVNDDKLKLAVARYWAKELAEKGLTF